jgi:aspartate aminotransferase
MPNAGFPQVRETVARHVQKETGLPFSADDILMTSGAACGCNIVLKAILNPGDEVIVLAPYFPEYEFYIANHGGKMICVETDEQFLPDIERIDSAITQRTKAIILNTPNNPTGRIYPESILRDLNSVLARVPQPVIVISDEPYKHLVFDGKRQAEVAGMIPHTVICSSASKSHALAGERIGYVALSPSLPDIAELRAACNFAIRTLGFVNASALWQLVLAESLDATVDIHSYQQKRDVLCDALLRIGYDVIKPEGAFYVFLKSPIQDDIEFVRCLAAYGVLCVPGAGFGRRGYVRLSLTVPLETIERSISGFKHAFQDLKASAGPVNE